MIDYFLKFTDIAEATTVLASAGIDINMSHGDGWDLYVVGTSYVDDVPQPGLLVNIRARNPISGIEFYNLNPGQPEVVFA
jgi:hypothetical protein